MARKTRKLTATTPVGTFTRRTARTYSHVIVQFESAAEREVGRLNGIERLGKGNLTEWGAQELARLLAIKPITEGLYTAVSWVGRPDLLAARLKGPTDCTAYPVDAE